MSYCGNDYGLLIMATTITTVTMVTSVTRVTTYTIIIHLSDYIAGVKLQIIIIFIDNCMGA